MEPAQPIRFGPFEVDLRSGELRKHGVSVKLQEQPAKILAALLARPGEVVTRAELVQLLWPDGTYVDFDHGLNAAVTRLRQALSDSADQPRYVETVARRGYRFVAEVKADAAEPIASEPPKRSAPPFARWKAAAGALFAVSLIVAAWWMFQKGEAPAAHSEPVPLTTLEGIETDPSLSPDGSQVAFAWNGPAQDNFDIYVKVVGAGEPLRLTNNPADDLSPAWSPDGRHIAFVRDGQGLFIVSPVGGAERKVLDGVGSPSWSTDGKYLVAVASASEKDPARIHLVRTDGSGVREIFTAAKSKQITASALSPDDRRLAWATCSGYECELSTAELDGEFRLHGSARVVAQRQLQISRIAWTARSDEIVFSEWDGLGLGTGLRLMRVAVDGRGGIRPLDFGGSNAALACVSRSGDKVAYSFNHHNTDLWVGENGQFSRSAISSTLNDESPQLSPDGRRVAFSSHRTGRQEVWVAKVDGSEAVPLTSSLASGTPRWSPDGQTIVYDTLSENRRWDIAVVPAAGGLSRKVVEHPADDIAPSFSRDGRRIYFSSNRDGQHAVFSVGADGGEAVRVSDRGGVAFESMDGKAVYIARAWLQCAPLFVQPLNGAAGQEVVPSVCMRSFTVTERGVYYIGGVAAPGVSAQQYDIKLWDPGTRVSTTVMTSKRDLFLGQGLTVSPNGKTIFMSASTHTGADLYLVEGFR